MIMKVVFLKARLVHCTLGVRIDACDFPKCQKLDCVICGSGGLHSRFFLIAQCVWKNSMCAVVLIVSRVWNCGCELRFYSAMSFFCFKFN